MKTMGIKLLSVLAAVLFAAASAQIEVLEETNAYRVVRHAYGETRVPKNPERIISNVEGITDVLVSLNVRPVGDSSYVPSFPEHMRPYLTGVTQLDYESLEPMLALKPDLILTTDYLMADGLYAQFSKIAPTVPLSAHPYNDAEGSLLDIGTLVGKRRAAEVRAAEYRREVEAARAQLAQVVGNETVAIFRVTPRGTFLLQGKDFTDVLYDELGLKPASIVPLDQYNVEVSLEMLPQLDADHLFLAVDNEEALKRLAEHPLWQSVPAVEKDNVYRVPYYVWMDGGIITNEMKIEDVLEALVGRNN